jgi:hypothetical protein
VKDRLLKVKMLLQLCIVSLVAYWRLPLSATFVDARVGQRNRVGPNAHWFAGRGNNKNIKKNAGTSIEVARELRSVPAACEPAGAAYGTVYSARRGYNGQLSREFPAPNPLVEKFNVR